MPTLVEIAGDIAPIIDTCKASALRERGTALRVEYGPHAGRYFASDAMRRVRDSLLRRLEKGERTLGYLIGDYGHGKTAAAIWLWGECERAGIAAVPPFQFTSFDDLVEAVSGWLYHAIAEKKADLLPQAEALRGRYKDRSVEQTATDLARKRGLALEVARAIVAEDIAPNVSIGKAAHVSDFLEAAAELAREAGYKGLVVFADEMQIFLEAGEVRDNIEDLRRLILALRPSSAPLGLMLVIHERIAMVVQENAGDAMQRMQADGAALNLGQHLDHTFPARLLDHLCQKAGMKRPQAADDAVTDALGQISLRKDLSNGPRTVAAAMARIARHHGETGRIYRVDDLARDYEEGRIVFDGQGRSLSGALATVLADEVVREKRQYADVARFLCMFPDGAPEKYLHQYGLDQWLHELADQRGLLGTVIYAPRAEQWALKALQLDANKDDQITAFVRQFRENWWYHNTPGFRLATARQAFAKYLLPELFARKGPGDAGRKFSGHWEAKDQLFRDPEARTLSGSFEGTASRFPDRAVVIAVGSDENARLGFRPDPAAHLTFYFALTLAEDAPQRIVTSHSEPRVDFLLNLDVNVGGDFPPELQLLRDSIVPRLCTAAVLLNLLFYIEEKIPTLSLPEVDRQQVREYLMKSARRNVEQMLFPLDATATGVAVTARGRQQLESVFEQKLAELYPDYRPLHTGRESQHDLDRYAKLLKEGGLRLTVKRGQAPVRMATTEFLQKTGQSSASQFDATVTRLRRLHLLQVGGEETLDRVRHLDFTLTEHPLEVRLREELEKGGTPFTLRRGGRDRDSKRLQRAYLERVAGRLGYGADELTTALNLARWREWLEFDAEGVWLATPDADPDALAREADALAAQVAEWAALDPDAIGSLSEDLVRLRAACEGATAEALSDLSIELRLLAERFRNGLRARGRELALARPEVERRAAEIERGLPLYRLSDPVTIPGAVGGRLEEARKRLWRLGGGIRSRLTTLARDADALREAEETTAPAQIGRTLALRRDLTTRLEALARESDEVRRDEQGLDAWKALALRAARAADEAGERAPDLVSHFAEWSDDVVTAFQAPAPVLAEVGGTGRAEGRATLQRAGEFAPRLDALEADLAARAQQAREAFRAFYTALRDLYGSNGVPAPREPAFDPQNPALAYDNLAADAARVLQEALRAQETGLAAVARRCVTLREVRGRDTAGLEAEVNAARVELRRGVESLTDADALRYRDGKGNLPALCGLHERAIRQRNDAAGRLAALARPDAPANPFEERVLAALAPSAGDKVTSRTPVPLAVLFQQLRDDQNFDAAELFAALQALYRSGNLDILVEPSE